ncbi:hypothetical protein U27_04632 [Candidatus Vecturithrix granuli]|uniref:DUF5615 domain-containing protein n=1 Tax=Vecturithrix granuli TaxID=1499967 RepID=A0A081BZB0_VECG1|nr:hypothetical protein U27_04632 [Candidatus Vecturithrix granuli]
MFSVYDDARGLDDNEIIQKAFAENRILITNDKDFGEKIFRENYPHKGVILLRLEDERFRNKIAVLRSFFHTYPDISLTERFVVITETKIRFVG